MRIERSRSSNTIPRFAAAASRVVDREDKSCGSVGSVLGIVVSVSVFEGIMGEFDSSLFHFALLAWGVAPFLFMLIVNLVTKYKVGATVGVYLCLVGYAYAMMEAIVWHPDAQGGLVFLFLPIYLVGLFTLSMFVAVVITDKCENRRQR
jgi:hypothetical protein